MENTRGDLCCFNPPCFSVLQKHVLSMFAAGGKVYVSFVFGTTLPEACHHLTWIWKYEPNNDKASRSSLPGSDIHRNRPPLAMDTMYPGDGARDPIWRLWWNSLRVGECGYSPRSGVAICRDDMVFPYVRNFSSAMDIFTSMAGNVDAWGINGSWISKWPLRVNEVPRKTSVSNIEFVTILLL